MKQRFQPCPFCGEPLPGNWIKVVRKPRTSWMLHPECDRAIDDLKRKHYRVASDKTRRAIMYINLNRNDTNGNILIYQ